MKRKYVTTQLERLGIAGVEITRAGLVTEDEELIGKLESSSEFNVWFFSAPTMEETATAAKEWARQVLAEEPIEAEPVSAGDLEEELEALAEQERLKAEQEQAEKDRLQASKESDLAYKEKFRPNAAAKAKAKAAAKK